MSLVWTQSKADRLRAIARKLAFKTELYHAWDDEGECSDCGAFESSLNDDPCPIAVENLLIEMGHRVLNEFS